MVKIARITTKQQLDAANLWADLLEEAKGRIASIDAAISGSCGLPAPLVLEYSYLQIRMLCELIALGCLIAHGDIAATHTVTLQTAWAADKIIWRLGKLHPNFYPHPIRLSVSPQHVHFDRLESGFLTKGELLNLYNKKCGDKLHRSSLKDLLATTQQTQTPNFADIVYWRNKIALLLNQHHIASVDNLSHFICMLAQAESGGHAAVAIALSPLPR
jgi:hypothetical protein